MSKTETPDIVERLQTAIDDRGKGSVWGYADLLEDAADEIERLRSELAKHQWRTMADVSVGEPVDLLAYDLEGEPEVFVAARMTENEEPFAFIYRGREYLPHQNGYFLTHWRPAEPLPSPPGRE